MPRQPGGRIGDRELTVRPTLRIRAGAPVRVLVTRASIRGPPQRPSKRFNRRAQSGVAPMTRNRQLD